MTCRKCQYEFCWVCMGPWSEHGSNYYNCNRFEESSSTDARDQQAKSRAALERYLHVSTTKKKCVGMAHFISHNPATYTDLVFCFYC